MLHQTGYVNYSAVLCMAVLHQTGYVHYSAVLWLCFTRLAMYTRLSNFFACYVASVRGKAWERGYTIVQSYAFQESHFIYLHIPWIHYSVGILTESHTPLIKG